MHTPGPYEMPGTDGGEFVICTDKGNGKRRTIAHAYKREDAILLAAAPAMLSALERVARSPDCARAVSEYTDVLAAIAKAKGETLPASG